MGVMGQKIFVNPQAWVSVIENEDFPLKFMSFDREPSGLLILWESFLEEQI